ncbi:MAG: hypothetical protein WAX89_06435, partial [Alphaproteobacteria bacterium]
MSLAEYRLFTCTTHAEVADAIQRLTKQKVSVGHLDQLAARQHQQDCPELKPTGYQFSRTRSCFILQVGPKGRTVPVGIVYRRSSALFVGAFSAAMVDKSRPQALHTRQAAKLVAKTTQAREEKARLRRKEMRKNGYSNSRSA